MPITIHPKVGQILLCDFSVGFKPPEMVKARRPVVVISPAFKQRPGLVTVVALSTKQPRPLMPYHWQVPREALPQLGGYQKQASWLKGDMVYAVGFHRLELIKLGKRNPDTGKRLYFRGRLSQQHMAQVYRCVLEALDLGHLSQYLNGT